MKAPPNITSGHPRIDHYLAESFEQVRGMSSRFAAAICGRLIRRQTEIAVCGNLIEIGTFEGRFFIAMALGSAANEVALGIDRFDWPNADIEGRFLANCKIHGIARDRYLCWKADSRTITVPDLQKKLGFRPARFIHIDSHHSRECLTNDLEPRNAVASRPSSPRRPSFPRALANPDFGQAREI